MDCSAIPNTSPSILIEGFIAVVSSLATLFLVSLAKYLALRSRYKKDVRNYDAAKLSHSFGHSVEDKDAHSRSKIVWEHDNTIRESNRVPGDCTIYGPYTNDFFEPGRYKASFRVYVAGIPADEEARLTLEVARIHTLDPQNRALPFKDIRLSGRELSEHNGEYYTYDFDFYTEGSGDTWEYRAKVNYQLFDSSKMVIRFDTIICKHCYSFLDVFPTSN